MTWVIHCGSGSCGLRPNKSRGELALESLYSKGDRIVTVDGSRPTVYQTLA